MDSPCRAIHLLVPLSDVDESEDLGVGGGGEHALRRLLKAVDRERQLHERTALGRRRAPERLGARLGVKRPLVQAAVRAAAEKGEAWLTAATARDYQTRLDSLDYVPGLGLSRERLAVHGVYVPELALDIAAEASRLRGIMDRHGNVNVFISEGAGVDSIVAEMTARSQEVPRDAFGHVKLDAVNPGKWFGEQFAKMLGAEKVLVQKSGYFARAAPANAADLTLIAECVRHSVACSLRRESGVVGQDEERGDALRAIEFARIKGGKAFDVTLPWFRELLAALGQPLTATVASGQH
jgi:pyrophosphate--fructose-6-phosphate 1-phosphotransferase